MAVYFVDSSALVKRYVREAGTSWVRRLTRQGTSNYIYLARITVVEVLCDRSPAERRHGPSCASLFDSLEVWQACGRAVYLGGDHAGSSG